MNILKIRNTMRVIMAGSALLFSLSGGAAFAQISVTGGNNTTGPNSENRNQWDINNHTNIDVENDAYVTNDNNISVEAGRMTLHDNTEVASLSTGNVTGNISVSNDLNSGSIVLPGDNGAGSVSANFSYGITGPSSANKNQASVDNLMDVRIRNDARIDNNLDLHVNTGHNQIHDNTKVGDVSTGNISITSSTNNKANTGASDVDLSGMQNTSVSGTFSNNTTGTNSENMNSVDVNNDSHVDIHNNANIQNDTNIHANTGHNNIEDNTVVGNVSTGDVNISLTTSNTAN